MEKYYMIEHIRKITTHNFHETIKEFLMYSGKTGESARCYYKEINKFINDCIYIKSKQRDQLIGRKLTKFFAVIQVFASSLKRSMSNGKTHNYASEKAKERVLIFLEADVVKNDEAA